MEAWILGKWCLLETLLFIKLASWLPFFLINKLVFICSLPEWPYHDLYLFSLIFTTIFSSVFAHPGPFAFFFLFYLQVMRAKLYKIEANPAPKAADPKQVTALGTSSPQHSTSHSILTMLSLLILAPHETRFRSQSLPSTFPVTDFGPDLCWQISFSTYVCESSQLAVCWEVRTLVLYWMVFVNFLMSHCYLGEKFAISLIH